MSTNTIERLTHDPPMNVSFNPTCQVWIGAIVQQFFQHSCVSIFRREMQWRLSCFVPVVNEGFALIGSFTRFEDEPTGLHGALLCRDVQTRFPLVIPNENRFGREQRFQTLQRLVLSHTVMNPRSTIVIHFDDIVHMTRQFLFETNLH